jgi:phytoene/squalene synthetase
MTAMRSATNNFQVLDHRIALSPLRKAWLAWMTSWNY